MSKAKRREQQNRRRLFVATMIYTKNDLYEFFGRGHRGKL